MKPDTHQDPSVKERLRVMEDMYERVRLVNVKLTLERDEARRDARHLQDLVNELRKQKRNEPEIAVNCTERKIGDKRVGERGRPKRE